jgi:heat shock protein HslJ
MTVQALREPLDSTGRHLGRTAEPERWTLIRPLLSAASLALMLLVATLGVSGCGTAGSDSHALDGTAGRLTGRTLSSLDPNSFAITAKFAGGTVSGSSAVNAYGARYRAGPGDAFSLAGLTVGGVGGIGPAMRAEQAYLTLLGEARSFKRSGSRLTLFDRHGNESLVFGAARP